MLLLVVDFLLFPFFFVVWIDTVEIPIIAHFFFGAEVILPITIRKFGLTTAGFMQAS